MARLSRFFVAAATCTAVVLLLTMGTYALHVWVGGHISVRNFLLKSFVLLPIVVGLVAGLWRSPNLNRAPLVAGLTGAAIGAAYAYFVPRLMVGLNFWRALGHWRFGGIYLDKGIDLPALVCATVAGSCAMLLSITARGRSALVTAVILAVTAVLVPGPTFDFITHNQELTVAIVSPCNGVGLANAPEVRTDVYSTPVDVDSVTGHVVRLLRNAGIAGSYRVSDLYREGHGRQALAIVVLNQAVVSKVEFQEPHTGDVIYLQQPDGWKKIPPQFPTLNRSLSLEPPLAENAIAGLIITGADGRKSGSYIWKATNHCSP